MCKIAKEYLCMKLRREIEPKMDIAESLYPQVLELILEYTEYCDENGDEDFLQYKILENKLKSLTSKDMTQYNLWEWWEEEGAEVLAFRISLPDPQKVENITKEELFEIVYRLKNPNIYCINNQDKNFSSLFQYYLSDYFHKFLKFNFKNYSYAYFCSHKDKEGNYFEYSENEIVDLILKN